MRCIKKKIKENAWKYERCAGEEASPHLASFLAAEPILNTMAMKNSPDLVVELNEETGYGMFGDHGGLQEKSLRVPLILRAPGIKTGTSPCPVRHVDIMPMILKLLEIERPPSLDGSAMCLY